MKKSPTWELVQTTSGGIQYFGFCKKNSDTVVLVGQSKREALQVINQLYHGTPYIPLTREAVNVEDVEIQPDPDEVTEDEVLTTEAAPEVE